MQDISLRGRNSARDVNLPRTGRESEQGYLLVMTGVIILILVFVLSSYSFVLKRDSHYKENYAAGQRFADIVTAAHFFAQQQVYDSSGPGTVDSQLLNLGLPDDQVINPIAGTEFEVEVRGADEAPVNSTTPLPIKAASAYVHLKIRTGTGRARAPSDVVAFLAGAASHGMSRVGIVGAAGSGGLCDANPTGAITRWGPDVSACLTSGLVSALGFTDVQDGDIIVPAWETALARNDLQVVFRYKQPERPDLNAMTTNLAFDNSALPPGAIDCLNASTNCMRGASEVRTADIDSTGIATVNNFLVRQGSNANLRHVNTNNTLRVYDQNGSPDVMTVNGAVDLSGTTTSVGKTIRPNTGGTINASSPNPILTNHLGAKVASGETPFDTTINLSAMGAAPPAPSAAINGLTGSFINDVNMTRAGGQFNTTGRIGVVGGTTRFSNNVGTPLNVFAATITTNNTANITNTTNNLDWSVGSIDQHDSAIPDATKRLTVQVITINQSCYGRACPDSINEDLVGTGW